MSEQDDDAAAICAAQDHEWRTASPTAVRLVQALPLGYQLDVCLRCGALRESGHAGDLAALAPLLEDLP